MQFNNFTLQYKNGIGLLTVHRPEKLNALNKATILELHQALKALDSDKTAVSYTHLTLPTSVTV